MTYTQTIYDNFNDNSFDTTLWTRTDSTNVVEASTVLTMTPTVGYEFLVGKNFNYDISAGNIVGCKVTNSGTATASTELYIGVQLSDGASLSLLSNPTPSGAQWLINAVAGSTYSPVAGTTTHVNDGPGNSWVNGTWVGVTMSGSVFTAYKSTDGQTWTEICHATITGTFLKTACAFVCAAGVYSGTTTYKAALDDVSIFVPGSAVAGKVKKAGAWVSPSAVKVRKAGAWVVPSAVKVRKAGAWVTPT